MKTYRFFLAIFLILGFLLLPHSTVLGQSSGNSQIGFFISPTSAPNTRIEVPVEIHNVQDLYALDVTIKFDPAILAVEDADPNQTGVQVALGKFLDPGMVLFNTVDNDKGTIHFVMTQTNPSEPKSGSGNLLVIYFQGIKEGESDLSFTNIQLSDRNGNALSAIEKDAAITISNGVPTQAATSIPVQDAGLLTQIPTMMPTATATPEVTPVPTLAGSKEGTGGESGNLPISVTGGTGALSIFQMGQLFLMKNWWIVLVLLIVVVAMVAYLTVTRKPAKTKK